jgi:hypothetical protein
MKTLVILTGNAHVNRKRLIRKLQRKGAIFVPLDLKSLTELGEINANIKSVNSFISRSEWNEIEVLSNRLSDEWKELIKTFAGSQYLNIASNDEAALRWFWNEIATVKKMAEICVDMPISKVHLFRFAPARHATYNGPSDIASFFLKKELAPHVKVRMHLPGAKPLFRHIADSVRSSMAGLISSQIRSKVQGSMEISNKPLLLCVFNPLELPRFESAFRSLSKKFQVIVATTGYSGGRRYSPVSLLRRKLEARASLKEMRRVASSTMESVLRGLRFQLSDILVKRWPELLLREAEYGRLIVRSQPIAIIVSSLDDLESQLPSISARTLGIPTIALTHSHVLRTHASMTVDALAYQYHFQQVYGKGYNALDLLNAKEILPSEVYQPTQQHVSIPSRPLILIVGADMSDFAGRGSLRLSLLDDQLVVLKSISQFAKTWVDFVDIAIKQHPANPDRSVFESLCKSHGIKIVNADDSLERWVNVASAVIVINLAGSAIIIPKILKKAAFAAFTDDFLALQSVFQMDSVVEAIMLNVGLEQLSLSQALWHALSSIRGKNPVRNFETQILYNSGAFDEAELNLDEVIWKYLRL